MNCTMWAKGLVVLYYEPELDEKKYELILQALLLVTRNIVRLTQCWATEASKSTGTQGSQRGEGWGSTIWI